MKFSITRSRFLEALQTVQNVVTGKGMLQILQNALGSSTKNLSNALSGQSKNKSSYENLTEDLENVAKTVLSALGQL